MTSPKTYATRELSELWEAVDDGDDIEDKDEDALHAIKQILRLIPKPALGASLLGGKVNILCLALWSVHSGRPNHFGFALIRLLLNAGTPLTSTSDLEYDAT